MSQQTSKEPIEEPLWNPPSEEPSIRFIFPLRNFSHLLLSSPGDYEVSIKFNDEHVPDSPFMVPVATLSDDARRLTIASLQVVPPPPGSPERCMVVVVYLMFLLSCRRRP